MPAPKKTRSNTLRQIRIECDTTQAAVAEGMGIAQGEVSVLEKRETLDNVRVHTLRRYVEALGGELELVAVVRGERFVIADEQK